MCKQLCCFLKTFVATQLLLHKALYQDVVSDLGFVAGGTCSVHVKRGLNQLAAIERWPDYTVKPVYSDHPYGLDQLAAIERWPDYKVSWA